MRLLPFLLILNVYPQQHTIYQSLDRGLTWTLTAPAFPGNPRINALAASGSNLLAATNSGLYHSPNQGRTWQKASNTPRINALAASPTTLLAATTNGLLTSPDNGATWAALPNFPARHVRSLLAAPGRLFAGTDSQGVYLSTDDGRSWLPLSPGLPAQSQVFALALHQGTLYAALYAKGLWAWDAIRTHWTRAGQVQPLALAAANQSLAIGHNPGGIHWSAQPASPAWQQAAAPFATTAPIWEMAGNDGLLIAGAAAGVYRSLDGGRSWLPAVKGLPPNSPGIAFLLHGGAVFAAVLTP